MAYIIKNIAKKKPRYFSGLEPCGLSVLWYEREKARIYDDAREAERVADMLNRYANSLEYVAGGEDFYIIEDL